MRKLYLLSVCCVLQLGLFAQQGVSINTSGSAPHSSAMLDVTSTSKGMLVPRMTSSQRTAISGPAEGLLVYDTTTDGFWFYQSGWKSLSGGQWTVGGSGIYNLTDNVGIGDSTPEEELTVNGTIKVHEGGTRSISIDDSEIKSQASVNNQLTLNGFEGVTNINAGGTGARFVNILNNNDGSQLRIGRSVTSSAMVRIAKNSFIEEPHLELFETGDSDGYANMSFKSSGGTSSSSFWLLRGRTSTSPVFAFYFNDGTTGKTFATLDGANQEWQHFTRVGINNNSPTDWLHISAPANQDALRVQVDGTTRLRVHGNGGVSIGYNPGSPAYALQLDNSATPLVGHARATAWTTYSDARVKRNVRALEHGLNTVMALQPKQYDHHSSEFDDIEGLRLLEEKRSTMGFLAQELETVLPEAVIAPEDETQDLYAVNYEKIIPVLTKAIQEQQRLIEQLQTQVAALTSDTTPMGLTAQNIRQDED